jgi:hypothetical protein
MRVLALRETALVNGGQNQPSPSPSPSPGPTPSPSPLPSPNDKKTILEICQQVGPEVNGEAVYVCVEVRR